MQQDKYLSWTTTTSHYGTCCSFHYNPLTVGFQPFASNTYGSEGGLSIVGTGYPSSGRGLSGNMYSTGLVVSGAFKEFWAPEGIVVASAAIPPFLQEVHFGWASTGHLVAIAILIYEIAFSGLNC